LPDNLSIHSSILSFFHHDEQTRAFLTDLELNDATILNILMKIPVKYEILFSHNNESIKNFISCNVAVRLRIISTSYNKQRKIFQCKAKNVHNQIVQLTFFRIHQNLKDKLIEDAEFVFFGKLEMHKDILQIIHPSILKKYQTISDISISKTASLRDKTIKQDIFSNKHTITPIYDIKQKFDYNLRFQNVITTILLNEKIDLSILNIGFSNYLIIKEIFSILHFPSSIEHISFESTAAKHLAFYEILASYYAIHLARNDQKQISFNTSYLCNIENNNISNKVLSNLPFELTESQTKCINEIYNDLASSKQMVRLLQGDVGSGKTIVALMALIKVVESGYKGCIIAPTSILAKQHYENFKMLCKNVDIKIALLTGKNSKKEKDNIKMLLRMGMIDILVSTHAAIYLNDDLENFALFIIDEQHNFGVVQRNKLISKSVNPHLLMTTATPIPRTLLMSLYKDISLSTIDHKPKSRVEIITKAIYNHHIPNLIERTKEAIKKNEKIYWVCPLIEEAEKQSKFSNVTERAEILKNAIKDAKIEVLHGKIKQEEKDRIMTDFKNGNLNLIVSTTVIEVGVDVKDATIIVIEDADKFGLAQLHQLRGRVGRGEKQSYCILIASKNAADLSRLQIIENSNNGFDIAELDLKNRGGGQILGSEQSGKKVFRFIDFSLDKGHFALINKLELSSPENTKLLTTLAHFFDYYYKIELIIS
jgi:ATP-dependent DNA helicase RecG